MFFKNPKSGNKSHFIPISFILLCVFFANGCYYHKEELLNPPVKCSIVPTFGTEIFPLIKSKCSIPNCHDATESGGHFFHDYKSIYDAKDHIYLKVVIEKTMPKTGRLTQAEIDQIQCWIDNGAPQ
jgi:hypothetical protein